MQIRDDGGAAAGLQQLPDKQRIAAVQAADAVGQAVEQAVRRQGVALGHAVTLTAAPAQTGAGRAGQHGEAVAVPAVQRVARQRADALRGGAGMQDAGVVAAADHQRGVALVGGDAGGVVAALAAQNAAHDGVAGDGGGVVAAFDGDGAGHGQSGDAAYAAAADEGGGGIVGHRPLRGALGQDDGGGAAVQTAGDTAHACGAAGGDSPRVDAARQHGGGADAACNAAETALPAAAQIAAAGGEGDGERSLVPAVRQAAVAGDAARHAADGGGLIGPLVGKRNGNVHLRGAACYAGPIGHGQQAADAQGVRQVLCVHIGQLDAAADSELADRAGDGAEQAQRGAARRLADVQAGDGVALPVKGAGVGVGCADDRPWVIAEVDVRRQHGVGLGQAAVDGLRQPRQLRRGGDAVGVVGRAAAGGLPHRCAVPAEAGGAVQQAGQPVTGSVIGSGHGGQAVVPRLGDGGVGGEAGEVHSLRCAADGGGGIGQRGGEPLPQGGGIAVQRAGQRRQGGDAVVCGIRQHLLRRLTGQRQRGVRAGVHIGDCVRQAEGGGQSGQSQPRVGIVCVSGGQ